MFKFTLNGSTHQAPNAVKLSAIYCELRDASGDGAGTFPTPRVMRGTLVVGRISYDGKVWDANERLMYAPPARKVVARPVVSGGHHA